MTIKTELYRESLRPRFHFTARYWQDDQPNPQLLKEGWINDVNGLTYLDGEYHLFAQRWWSCWLHAVSKDLVHWEELPPAFGMDEAFGGTQSGGAVIDHDNTSGLATGETPVMVAFWSSQDNKRQCISYSNDKGRSWTKYEKNPVLVHPFRDPRVFRYQDRWIMLLYGPEEKGVHYYTLFSSVNLLQWEKIHSFPGFYECPDMFELPVRGSNESKWVVINGDGRYCLGSFDGREFKRETELLSVDHGRNFYATMTWGEGLPGSPARRIQAAWMRYWEKVMLNMPFNQQHACLCDLSLRQTEEGIRLFREPIPELARLYAATHTFQGGDVLVGETDFFASLRGDVFDACILVDLSRSKCGNFTLSVRGHYITFAVAERRLNVLGCNYVLPEQQDTLSLRILSDTLSIEVFVDEGRASFSNVALPVDAVAPLRLYSEGGPLRVISASVHEIKSMWE